MHPSPIESIQDYVNHRKEPGGFVSAVLANDLFLAITRADPENLANLKAIVNYVYNNIPAVSWGSWEKVNAWLDNSQGEDEGT